MMMKYPDEIKIPTYHQANYSILVPVLDMVFEDFMVIVGAGAAFFLVGMLIFQVFGGFMVTLGIWSAGAACMSFVVCWLRQIYRERGEIGSDQVLVDAIQFLLRSRRLPGRRWE